jgi:hypothetical protein
VLKELKEHPKELKGLKAHKVRLVHKALKVQILEHKVI